MMLALHQHVAAATCPPVLFHDTHSETSIIAAMAAALGSSLFLFHSLDHNLATILKQAGRPQSLLPSASSLASPATPSHPHGTELVMGSRFSKHRKIDPRDQQQPKKKRTQPPPCHPAYILSVQCTHCIGLPPRRRCKALPDLMANARSIMAYRDPWAEPPAEISGWIIRVDFCSPANWREGSNGKRALRVLQRFLCPDETVRDGGRRPGSRGSRGGQRVAPVLGVAQVEAALRAEGVEFRSDFRSGN
jgi:hypothetical protein